MDFQGYEEWQKSQSQAVVSSASSELQSSTEAPGAANERVSNADSEVNGSSVSDDAPTRATFAEICEMIAQGKPIPGVKEIPDTILEGQGTHASANQRKKPWEKEGAMSSKPSWQT